MEVGSVYGNHPGMPWMDAWNESLPEGITPVELIACVGETIESYEVNEVYLFSTNDYKQAIMVHNEHCSCSGPDEANVEVMGVGEAYDYLRSRLPYYPHAEPGY